MSTAMEAVALRQDSDAGSDADDIAVQEEHIQGQTRCGIGSWRPSCLQRCANIKTFTVTLSLWTLFGSINFSYYTSVITQIEKQFGLSSAVTGFIKNVDNIGYLSTVLLFSHFCRNANKPRLFASATLVSSTAIFIFALPHFIYGISDAFQQPQMNATQGANASTVGRLEYCDGVHEEDHVGFCHGRGTMAAFNMGALGLFIFSELLQGLGQSPKFTLSLTYMDDNAKDSSPKYFSFMFAMRAFSPVIGYMLGAWATSIYVDFSDPGISQKDPRWVGAWWLGFVICAGCSLVWAVPMLLFPPILRGGEGQLVNTEQGENMMEKAKDLPKALWRLATNKLFVLMVLALSFEVYVMGYFTFLPKYLEQYYGQTAAMASIITGAIGALAAALGPIVSGQVVTLKKKITPYYAVKLIVIFTGISLVGYTIMLVLSCPEEMWAGHIDRESPDLRLECNGNCSCDSLTFEPICGDSVNYYSPCHAGCTDMRKENGTTLFTGCQCIEGGQAEMGMCKRDCKTVIPYAIALFFTMFIGRMDIIPTMTIFMRCVDYRDKAISLATVSAILQIMSFPAPIVFGLVIDSACQVLQGTCARTRGGACLLYDGTKFRLRLHGFTLGVKIVGFLIYLIALYVSRHYEYADQRPDEAETEDNGNDKDGQESDGEEMVVYKRSSNHDNNVTSI